jgi:hypothetical protein
MQSGTFDQARGIIDEVINGQDNGLYHGELALQRARELLDRPPVTEQDLNSREARRLWDFGRKLLTTVQADLEAARRRQADVDRLENDWQDSYRRFESAIEAVTDELRRPFIQRIGRGAELAELKVQARAAYMACEQLCPRHPDLAGWADNEMLR